MKYELIKTDISAERTIMQDITEITLNENQEEVITIIGTEPTDSYEVTITLGIHSIDNIAPDFSKDIIIVHHNSQTGFEVDEQRQLAIETFINEINQDDYVLLKNVDLKMIPILDELLKVSKT